MLNYIFIQKIKETERNSETPENRDYFVNYLIDGSRNKRQSNKHLEKNHVTKTIPTVRNE